MRLFVGLGTALLVTFGSGLVLAANAAELSPGLRALVEHFQAHRRIALGYLQAGNADLGAIAVERLRSDLMADRGKLASPQPDALTQALTAVQDTAAASLKAIDSGDVDKARGLLGRVAAPLDTWRKANGVRLFSDCIAEINAVYRRLDVYRATPPDLGDAKTRDDVAREVAATAAATARCDSEAPPPVHSEAEFRRLIDGMTASLRQMPDALQRHDADLLHRLIDEQRAFDRLLAFRFG